MKDKILNFFIYFTFTILLFLIGIISYRFSCNYFLEINEEVYLGGDNIIISYVSSDEENGVTSSSEYATIGTMTFIRKDGRYASVAHSIQSTNVAEGRISIEPVISVERSFRNLIGEKNVEYNYGNFDGTITSFNKTGVYGKYNGDFTNRALISLASPREIKKEKAYIYTTIDDENVVAFEIEIVHVFYSRDNHNIRFRVIDEELISETGGIIKGMSGSPIVQNGKIIGAVSHVDENDPLYGYGLFISYMI